MSLDELFERFKQGDRRALARLLTLAAQGSQSEALRTFADRQAKPARVVAVTGAGGVGKSTLTGRLVAGLRQRGLSVAVLACDPESPLSGGALLGDRLRIAPAEDDPKIFVRSLAAVSGGEAVAENLDLMVKLLAAFGFEMIVLETAGAGQGDIAVRALADVVVLLVQPQAGDDLQWQKAGVLEVADVIVVHKSDLPGAARVHAQVKEFANLVPGGPVPEVLMVSSTRGEGFDALCEAILSTPSRRDVLGRPARRLLRLAQQQLAQRFHQHQEDCQDLLDRWQNRQLSDTQAAEALLDRLGQAAVGKPPA